MEFVAENEVTELLEAHRISRISETAEGGDRIYLEMDAEEDGVHVHLACNDSAATPRDGATTVNVEKDRLPQVVEHIFHLLHMDQILLFPVGKWRKVFDAVAFSLAENEDWQEIDAAATVELNTRDPLLCESGDLHTLIELIRALLNDAESPDQGLMLVPTALPVLMEVVPDGAVRLDLGTQVLADEVADALQV